MPTPPKTKPNPAVKPEAVATIRKMPKDQWFGIGDCKTEEAYKTLIYLLTNPVKRQKYTLVSTPDFLRYIWKKSPSA